MMSQNILRRCTGKLRHPPEHSQAFDVSGTWIIAVTYPKHACMTFLTKVQEVAKPLTEPSRVHQRAYNVLPCLCPACRRKVFMATLMFLDRHKDTCA